MWLPRSILLSIFVAFPLVFAAQITFQQDATVVSHNIVDALSDDPDYTSLLKLLMLAKLIPTLNKLEGATLFAPTNDAIKKAASTDVFWQNILSDDISELRDNVQEKLRQELFYHLLNNTLEGFPRDNQVVTLLTLHYPRTPTGPPSHEPPPNPPWMPIPGGTLGGRPQRLRLSERDDNKWVGVDAFGENGVKVSKKPVNASNGLVVGIGELLKVPPSIATIISLHPKLSYLQAILTPEILGFLNSTSPLTIFLPEDKAWEALPHYERLYLESKYATDDLTRIVNMHAVVAKEVYYTDEFKNGLNLTTVEGRKLNITHSVEDNKTNVSTSHVVEPDIYASNGVVHTVSSLLIPPGTIELTPEKYLLVLNCTSFVSLLHSVNLTSLVNDTEAHWTILAPRDDVIELFRDGDLPPSGSEELKKLLLYHFIPGKKTPEKLKDGSLIETALEEPGLGGARQVMGVTVHDDEGKDKQRSVSFGGAGTIGEPIKVNNTLIYFISRPLVPPTDPLATALPSLDLSSFLAAIFSTTLAEKLKTSPRTTLLFPHNSAFKRLGMLVSAHLLAATSKPDLERVIQHHAIAGVEYASSLQNGSQRTYGTLEGSDLHIERHKADDNTTALLTPSGGWADMHSELFVKDTLTQTGVIHEVSDIMIPRTVDITVGKLIRAAKGTTMVAMMTKAGLEWMLNGTSPPDGSIWADMGLSGEGWTVLCPTEEAFKALNLTEVYANSELLRDIVVQHLVPSQQPSQAPPKQALLDSLNNNRPLVISDSATYTTLRSATSQSLYADLVFRELDGQPVVGIKGARGDNGKDDWAHVTTWGRSTTGGGIGGVLQIDRLLVPYYPSPWVEYGGPVAVGVLGVFLICAFFYGVRAIWKRDFTEATYEPVGGFSHDDDEVER